MYNVRVVNEDGTETALHQCVSIQTTNYRDFFQVELMPECLIIRLPEDGDVIYVMNDNGDTVDSYRYDGSRRDEDNVEREAR